MRTLFVSLFLIVMLVFNAWNPGANVSIFFRDRAPMQPIELCQSDFHPTRLFWPVDADLR